MSTVLEKTFKALVVDDHPLIRKGISNILNCISSISCCHQAENGLIALEKCRTEHYDLIFLDIGMPVMDGLTAMHHIKHEFPKCQVIIMTMHENPRQFIELIELGVSGYLLKETDEVEITKAVTLVMEGSQYFTNTVYQTWTAHVYEHHHAPLNGKYQYLSLRELEVLNLICMQMSAAEIGNKLCLSNNTVNNHRSSIMKKTGIHTTVGLVIYAIKNGIFKP
jgi:two-component system, NarL family, response regulator DegU